MLLAWNTTLISLYLDYNITEDFQTQFQQNSAEILSLIETMMPINTPVSEKEKTITNTSSRPFLSGSFHISSRSKTAVDTIDCRFAILIKIHFCYI